MIILTVPISTWDDVWSRDPDAMAEAVADLWDGCYVPRQGGRTGGTYDDDGNELSPDTHYQWSLGARVRDVDEQTDGLEELSYLIDGVLVGDPIIPVEDSTDATRLAARRRARILARVSERADERQAQRVEARIERRTQARQAYRTASRTAARTKYNATKTQGDPLWSSLDAPTQASYNDWSDWADLDSHEQARWLRNVANIVGHPDVKLRQAADDLL